MNLHQTPPGKGKVRKRVHFNFENTEAGKTWNAWCAGKCTWLDCHCSTRTKPCLDAVTKGALECPWCAKRLIPKVIGYFPLFRESDGKPCFIVVQEYSRDIVDSIKFRHAVVVGRGSKAKDAVWVRPWPGTKAAWHSSLPELMQEADLEASLLAVWKLPDLSDWCQSGTLHKIHYRTL